MGEDACEVVIIQDDHHCFVLNASPSRGQKAVVKVSVLIGYRIAFMLTMTNAELTSKSLLNVY